MMTMNGTMEPKYVDYQKLFSTITRRRDIPALRKFAPFMLADGYLKMAGGFPNPQLFPVLEADFKLRDGSVLHIDEKQITTHLQYGLSEGYTELREWVTEFQRKVHTPPTLRSDHPGRFDVIITNGSNEGISLSVNLFLNEGDWMLVEEATYSTALSMVSPFGASVQSVRADDKGMNTQDLTRILTSWDELHPGCPKPKFLYAVASGGNPTGVTWSLDRKKAAYELARKHDFMIVEDEAYYYLQFSRPMVPSFLSLDVDGRVIRLDSFSKIIAPGLRVGIVTGPAPCLLKMRAMKDCGSGTPSGLSQVLLSQLLIRYGHDGLLRHVDTVMEFYQKKAEMAVKMAERHLSGLAEWATPAGGMFLWLRVLGVKDSHAIFLRALDRHLVTMAGTYFSPTKEVSAYMRLSYACITEEQCDQAFRILAEVIREERKTEKN